VAYALITKSSKNKSEIISIIDYPKIKISGFAKSTKIQKVLPIRVSFKNTGILAVLQWRN
jgi:hypothetical protein